jgi:glycosyltransferase involved in cell wall biosynthesis
VLTPTVDVVFPCLNEAAALPAVLLSLPHGYRALVVDNGSTDGSARVAADLGATVISESHRGFGAAAHAGLVASSADIVAFCDADGSFDSTELSRVVDPVRRDQADLVLGRRRPTHRRAWSLHARLANRALAARLRFLTGVPVHDLGPMRAGRREDLLALNLLDRRSGYPLEMFLAAATAGWRVLEVDVSYQQRVGRSKITGTMLGTITAINDMSRLLRTAAQG